MEKEEAEEALKAAAWRLVDVAGYQEARCILHRVEQEIHDVQWKEK